MEGLLNCLSASARLTSSCICLTQICLKLDMLQFMWWSTYEASSPPSRETARPEIYAQLMERHGSWRSPYDSDSSKFFSRIIELACGPNDTGSHTPLQPFLILPQYITPRIPHWCSLSGSGRIVLIGELYQVFNGKSFSHDLEVTPPMLCLRIRAKASPVRLKTQSRWPCF